ncbi:fluoride efflux transporter CrcB [Pseudomonas sp. F1_0610]|uniref:fluoride efflux transporter CrcB n=1 Tax=Pseudomonas sp. F1_0610 TaxID=3114284 RepID=UPI0039C494A5
MNIAVFFAIALGGAVGSLLRYMVGLWVSAHWASYFYLATFSVNILGSFLMGCLYGLFLLRPEIPEVIRLGSMVGLLGGFTTFSSFSIESFRLLQNGHILTALGYILLSVALGLLAAWAGVVLTKS